MGWKKVVDSDDAFSFRKAETSGTVVNLEARRHDDGWEIVKTLRVDQQAYVEQYFAESHLEAKIVIERLKAESRGNQKQHLNQLRKRFVNGLNLTFKRVFKENNVEKWKFTLEEGISNTLTIRYGKIVEIDICLHDRYKLLEETIVKEVLDTFSLDEVDADIFQNIYYFTKKNTFYLECDDNDFVVGEVELGFKR